MQRGFETQFSPRYGKVTAVDFHPNEPWIATAMYSGHVHIYNYETGTIIKTSTVANKPVHAIQFNARESWLLCGDDDGYLSIWDSNTFERVITIIAASGSIHTIRALAVHPTQPYILTVCSDATIKCWDWTQSWRCALSFQDHPSISVISPKPCLTSLALNPLNPDQLATASWHGIVKVWSLAAEAAAAEAASEAFDLRRACCMARWAEPSTPLLELQNSKCREGCPHADVPVPHYDSECTNYVAYHPSGDPPRLVTASDDHTVKVWDLALESRPATLVGHAHDVDFAVFHPELPVIISGAEDGGVRIWCAETYRLLRELGFGMGSARCVVVRKGRREVGIGLEEGVVVLRLEEGKGENEGLGEVQDEKGERACAS